MFLLALFLCLLFLGSFVEADPTEKAKKLVEKTKSFLDNSSRQKMHRDFLFDLFTSASPEPESKIKAAAKIIYKEGTVNQCFTEMLAEWKPLLDAKNAISLRNYFSKHAQCPEAKYLVQRLPKTPAFSNFKYELLAEIETVQNPPKLHQDLQAILQPQKVHFYSNNRIPFPVQNEGSSIGREVTLHTPTPKDWILLCPALICTFTLMEFLCFLFVRALQ